MSVALIRLIWASFGECANVYRVPRGVGELDRIYGETEQEQRRGTSHSLYDRSQS